MRFTFPYEVTELSVLDRFQAHEPTGKEHVITEITHEHRGTKVVTIVEATPFDEFEDRNTARADEPR